MSNLYELVGEFTRSRPWPKGFYYEIRENDERLTFVMWQDNLDKMTGDALEQLKVILMQIALLNNQGIPIVPVVRPRGETWMKQ